MARVYSEITVESIVEKAGIFTVNFDFKPQRFLKTGEHMLSFGAAGTIWNPTLFPAKPIITVYGTGAGTVTVGDQTVTIKAIEDQIILDCDLQQAYRQLGDGAPENMNGNIKAPDFPQLLAGGNPVRWTGDIERVEIIPRWWTL
jgi:phage-related protein